MTGTRAGVAVLAVRRVSRSALVATVVLLAACATKEPPPSFEELHPRSIAIIPILPAETLSLDRKSVVVPVLFGLIGTVIERTDRSYKQSLFVQRFGTAQTDVAGQMTRALVLAGQRRGFETFVLDGLVRDIKDPQDFDYTKIDTRADVIAHVQVTTVGVYSKAFDNDYIPQIDVTVALISRRTGRELVNENFYYGVNASRKAFWAVEADDRFRFPDFDALVARPDDVKESWSVGSRLLADRIVEQLDVPSLQAAPH